jgi:hypothetical protein
VGHRSGGLVRRLVVLAGGFVVVAGVLHLWAGPHVYDQLGRSRRAVSLATPWRPVLEWARESHGDAPTRYAIGVAAAVLAVVLAWCLLRLSRPIGPGTFSPDAGRFTFAPLPFWCPGERPGIGRESCYRSARRGVTVS